MAKVFLILLVILKNKLLELASKIENRNTPTKIESTSSTNRANLSLNKLPTDLYISKYNTRVINVYSDGAVSGNPGIGGIGCVLYDKDGVELWRESQYLGYSTNNIAEYKALILGLELALLFSPESINFYADSELVVKQIKKEYKVKNAELQGYFQEFYEKIGKISFSINHIRREFNKVADSLALAGKKLQ